MDIRLSKKPQNGNFNNFACNEINWLRTSKPVDFITCEIVKIAILGLFRQSQPQLCIFRASNLGNNEVVCRLENAIFETSGSKMVAINKKGEMAKAITP